MAPHFNRLTGGGSIRRHTLLGITLLCAVAPVCAAAQGTAALPAKPSGSQQAGPDLRVEYFGAERGYAVGMESVSVLCVLRNAGRAPVPANAVRLYCYPLLGLDYTAGEIKPMVPELIPGQSVAFRWALAPAAAHGRLLTAVMLQPGGATSLPAAGPPELSADSHSAPPALLAEIPHFASAPALGSIKAGAAAGPTAVSRAGEAWLANDRVSLHARAASGEEPVLSLAAKDGANWRVLADANSLVELLSAEDGQRPWWRRFRWRDTAVRSNRDEGAMTLFGRVGPRWEVEMTLTARRDTGAVEGRIRLTARQTTRLFGVRLPGLMSPIETPGGPPGRADGRPFLLAAQDPPFPETPRLLAAHRGGVTFGIAWPSRPPLEGWSTEGRIASQIGLLTDMQGGWSAPERGDLILAGASIEIPFHYFAIAPSDSVQDASRFALP